MTRRRQAGNLQGTHAAESRDGAKISSGEPDGQSAAAGMTSRPAQAGAPAARKGPGVRGVFKSVLGAMFGVQSSRVQETDFTHGKPLAYILGGILFTLCFIVGLILVTRMVLPD